MIEDAQGNVYQYDLDNRINRIEVAATNVVVEFKYDAMSRRVLRKQGVEEVAYLWWGDQETAEHTSGAGQPVIQNDIWAHPTALNQIIARAVDGDKDEIQYYHKNYLDHVYAVSDDQGNLLEHYRYTAFGEPEIYSPQTQNKLAGSAIANPVLWNSRRYDEQTDLYYYKYRHYKADIGRWLGRDPIEERGGVNLYGFVGNRPINWWDKFGLRDPLPEDEPPSPWGNTPIEEGAIARLFDAIDAERKPRLDAGWFKCCDKEKIAEGKKLLEERYSDVLGVYGKLGRSAIQPGAAMYKAVKEHPDNASCSCFEMNQGVLGGLAGIMSRVRRFKDKEAVVKNADVIGIPKCWQCAMVHKSGSLWEGTWGLDHWWVECKAYDKNGALSEHILFDSWKGYKESKDATITNSEYPNTASTILDGVEYGANKHGFGTVIHHTCNGKLGRLGEAIK